MFYAETLSIELIEALRPLVPRIKRCDRSLADQLTRAASSVALNIAESNYSDPGNARLGCSRPRAAQVKRVRRCALPWRGVTAVRSRERARETWSSESSRFFGS
jgi:hypothetical protein